MSGEYLLHTVLAVWAVITGAFLCAVYDIFRLFRLCRRVGSLLLFFSDLVFCTFATVCLLILFFNLSYGRVRMYALVLVFFGFLIWRFTVSRIVMTLLLKLIRRTQKIVRSIKMRISVRIKRLFRRIYTRNYCRRAVKSVFRKDLKND